MGRLYSYELWNGKEVVGKYVSINQLQGTKLIIFEQGILKQSYFRKAKTVEVPIITRCVYDDGVEYRIRRCLDVRKKSKRQINILKKALGEW